MLSILKGPKFEQILQKARENWIEFTPTKEEVVTAGIDSSFNNTKFQGIELWATTAVSIKSDGEILVDLHDSGLGSDTDLSRIASKMEIDACEKTVDLVDLVLMDGSLHSQFMTRQSTLGSLVVKTMKRRNNVIFIAKTSNTKKQFENLGSLAGDIFYYNHVTNSSGFSKIFVEKKYGTDKVISPSSEPILIYSPTDSALEVIAVTNVGFDSPTTKPKLNLIPPVNQFHYSILTN